MHDFGDRLVGSGRSPETFNLVEAFKKHRNLLSEFGGHKQAAGFSIKKENVEEFAKSMKKYAFKKLAKVEGKPILKIDCEINEDDIGNKLVDFLEKMEPFGMSNEQPVFLIRGIEPNAVKKVGKDLTHLHFFAQTGKKSYPVIGFKMGESEDYLRDNNKIDLVCHVENNEWKGTTKIQLRAVDISASN